MSVDPRVAAIETALENHRAEGCEGTIVAVRVAPYVARELPERVDGVPIKGDLSVPPSEFYVRCSADGTDLDELPVGVEAPGRHVARPGERARLRGGRVQRRVP